MYENESIDNDVLSMCMECGGSGHIPHMTNLPGFTVCWGCDGLGVATSEDLLLWS